MKKGDKEEKKKRKRRKKWGRGGIGGGGRWEGEDRVDGGGEGVGGGFVKLHFKQRKWTEQQRWARDRCWRPQSNKEAGH